VKATNEKDEPMLRDCWKPVGVGAVFLVLGLAGMRARAEGEKPITAEEFGRLHEALRLPKGEAWRGLPWHESILEARAEAVKEKKPIYMLVRSGNPLGCV
jgi:hypothetical protein